MKITDLLSLEAMSLNLSGTSKEQVIDEMVDMLDSAGKLNDKEEYKREIWKRENQSSTGLEEGIAIPHAKTAAVKSPCLAFGLHKTGVDFDALDEEDSNIFFMIAASADATDSHIETLSRLTTYLLDDDFREELLKVESKQQVLDLINKKESGDEEVSGGKMQGEFIVAVTACPTGIAHTYMAANNLKEKAEKLGVEIKVETNGSVGVKNALTADDIAKAKAVIVAADKKVDMTRFNGKHVIQVPVVQGIKNADELIKKAVAQDAPIYKADSKAVHASEEEEQHPVKKYFYKPLMNGVSNMLPFVVGGGILIAISFMFGIKAFDPSDAAFNPFAKFLMDIGGGGAFSLMIPILAGFIGMAIADRPAFMPAMVGGLMAKNSGGGFLGGLIAGFLAGYVILALKKALAGLPEALEGLKPVLIFPLLGLFITGGLMTLILVPVAGINNGMAAFLNNMGTGNLVLLGIVLGGMMAVDMGGPVNKAAFTFGIAMIESGNLAPHAAVMAGGMVPPLAIALSTSFFKNKFSEAERKNGVTNYVMGASFITEGAIPFAAADPVRVLPACILGSAVAGGLAMLFGCTLPAPHGGLFVLPLVGNWPMYLIAVAAGSVLTAVIIGMTKPVVEEA